MHNRHAAPKTPKHLAELEAHIAGAEDEQMLRHLAYFHERFVCQIASRIEAGNLWRMRTRACVDEDALALQNLLIDSHLVPGYETRMPMIEAHVGMASEVAFLSVPPSLHDGILAIDNRGKVDARRTASHTPTPGVPRVIGHLRACNHRLRGCAAGVDAGAAQVRFLDESYGPAVFGEGIAQRIAPLSRANHDGVVFFHVRTRSHSGATRHNSFTRTRGGKRPAGFCRSVRQSGCG